MCQRKPWRILLAWGMIAVQTASIGSAARDPRAPESGVYICGVVDANRVLVDFAKDHPVIVGTQVRVIQNALLELTFNRRNGCARLAVPEQGGWKLAAYVAVAVDLRNSGKTPVTLVGKLNHDLAAAALVHLEPGQADTLVMYLCGKGRGGRFKSMNCAPGGDLRIWNGSDEMVVRQLEFCDLDGQAVGGTITVNNIRAVGKRLELKPAGAAFFPFVDRFGQYKHGDWPNKVGSVDALRTLAREEAVSLKALPRCAGWSKFGGWSQGPQLRATGHFRTEKHQGKWWLVDPEGYLFWSTGADGVCLGMTTPVTGRENYFAAIPESGARHGEADFVQANMQLKYQADWRNISINLTHQRLAAWGMNTCGNWSEPQIYQARKTPYVVAVWLGDKHGAAAVAIRGNAEALRKALQEELAQHAAAATDPWCIGYFIDNELDWKQVPDIKMYFRVVSEEMKRAAPRKLYLGSRIHNGNSEALKASAQYCDVVSINCYAYTPVPTPLDVPYIIGEFHFGALDRGLLATGLRAASNQEQRANAYKHYMREAMKRPNIVGAHWFTFRDQALTGRGDGENYQIGMVDVCDTPYQEMIKATREIGVSMYSFRNAN